MIKLRIFRWGDYPGLSDGLDIITRIFVIGVGNMSSKRNDKESKRFE